MTVAATRLQAATGRRRRKDHSGWIMPVTAVLLVVGTFLYITTADLDTIEARALAPDVILEKVAKLRDMGVDHCCALMFPAHSIAEMDEQIEWFAKDVMAQGG